MNDNMDKETALNAFAKGHVLYYDFRCFHKRFFDCYEGCCYDTFASEAEALEFLLDYVTNWEAVEIGDEI